MTLTISYLQTEKETKGKEVKCRQNLKNILKLKIVWLKNA